MKECAACHKRLKLKGYGKMHSALKRTDAINQQSGSPTETLDIISYVEVLYSGLYPFDLSRLPKKNEYFLK